MRTRASSWAARVTVLGHVLDAQGLQQGPTTVSVLRAVTCDGQRSEGFSKVRAYMRVRMCGDCRALP